MKAKLNLFHARLFCAVALVTGTSFRLAAATFSDTNWISMGGLPGANGTVSAAVVDGSGNLYIGGSFTVVGDAFATNIAKWNGSNWSAQGSGVNGPVLALAVSGSNVYAGGIFTIAGTSAATNIAKWNGSSWSALASGMDSWVGALAVSGSEVYAGGYFTRAGGRATTNIAKWNGSTWTALGSGIGGITHVAHYVNALAVSGGDLYAGGYFTTAGGSAANYIAKWNGSSWSALGPGMDGEVLALAVSGSDLYAGGDFTTAGGSAANYIAKWNGSTWSALGSGMGGSASFLVVDALSLSGSDVYAGGLFTMAGGSSANFIARWNGSSWSALGSGMAGSGAFVGVYALAVWGSELFAGGEFTTAGGKVSAYIARAYLERPTLSILRSGGDVTLSWPTFYDTFALQQNPDAAKSTSWSDANYPLTTNGAIKSATVPIAPPGNQFFRLIGN